MRGWLCGVATDNRWQDVRMFTTRSLFFIGAGHMLTYVRTVNWGR